jgi:membrane protein DedA with SNARE-associated domain
LSDLPSEDHLGHNDAVACALAAEGTSTVEDFLRSWGYLGIFLGILATGLGFPMPEELPIVVGGALAGSGNAFWWLMLPVCIVGVVIGDSFLYLIGRFWGARLVQIPFIRKHLLTPERLESISDNFDKHGIKILLFARLTPGIRAPIFLTAGISRLSLTKFLLSDSIYAIPGVSLLYFLGFWFTDTMVDLVKSEAGKVKPIIILVVLVGVTGYVFYRILRRPVVTGSPQEMPPLVGQVTQQLEGMTHKLEGVTHKILHPHSTPETAEATPPVADKQAAGECGISKPAGEARL